MPAVKHTLLDQDGIHDMNGLNKHQVKNKSLDIIDIRRNNVDFDLKAEVAAMMTPADGGPRALPTMLLYDEEGLQLFEQITYLEEYYLTGKEIEVLKKSSADIASKIPNGAMVIELGSGNLRKVCLLLQAFEDVGKAIDYYALDLNRQELERTLAQVPEWKHVSCHGLFGTYDDGMDWLKQPANLDKAKCILHLGSSIGNFHRDEAASFLEGFVNVLNVTDSIILGLDSCSNPEHVYHAYNDAQGLTHRFVLNGLENANKIYGEAVFNVEDWQVIGEYVYDDEGGRHQAFVTPTRETSVLGNLIQPRERIKIEQSLKYSDMGARNLWKRAGLRQMSVWDQGKEYGLHMLQKANLPFPRLPQLYAQGCLPSLHDWAALWETWDIVTRKMLPEQQLLQKPIKLRNACIFYLGHIPAQVDIQLCRVTKEPPTDPAYFHDIFERGIDPDVDDPAKCHDHSEVPDEWPPVDEILAYQDRVRARIRKFYDNGQDCIPRHVGRAIWLGFEHEMMHLETLLYMMLQSDQTLPPPHTEVPDFEAAAKKAYQRRVPNEWFELPEQNITLGMEDPEEVIQSNGYFGWDIEKPARHVKVHKFEAKGRPITNEEYAKYLYESKHLQLPASWSEAPKPAPHERNTANGHSANGSWSSEVPYDFLANKTVRTVYGLVPLQYALDWPVFASYDELAGCASWMGGRIPTHEEASSIYAYSEAQRGLPTRNKLEKKVPAVNGHLINDGVEETPPSSLSPSSAEAESSDARFTLSSLFIDLTAENVGFTHWHPVAVTHLGGRLGGQASMGGVWEWTSTPLSRHAGFEPMPLYPGYSADFFDEKHNIVLGGSWASHPRIAGRKSFVNWFQRNYPFAWVGARLVRDI